MASQEVLHCHTCINCGWVVTADDQPLERMLEYVCPGCDERAVYVGLSFSSGHVRSIHALARDVEVAALGNVWLFIQACEANTVEAVPS